MSSSGRLVIDAHQHVWDPSRSPYDWLGSPGLDAIRRTIGFGESLARLDAAGVTGSVLVQADDTDEDTDLMLEAAAAESRVLGVVGWVPLDSPDRAEERLGRLSSIDAFVGVRALIHDRPDPDWILRPEVDEGLAVLERLAIPFDFVAVLPRHLENLATVAERHPGLPIVLDHLGKPPIGSDSREPWWSLIGRAAEHPRVVAKLSGLYATGSDPAAWTTEQIGPFVERALDVFGADRLLYGGDWPFSVPAGDYERTWSAVDHHLAALDEPSATAILGGTARRVYGLQDSRIEAALRARHQGAVR